MAVVMYAPNDLRVMGVCDGPAAGGRCPRVAAGEEVPCWGLDLVLTSDDALRSRDTAGRPRFHVTPGTSVCPLAGLVCAREYFSPFAPQN